MAIRWRKNKKDAQLPETYVFDRGGPEGVEDYTGKELPGSMADAEQTHQYPRSFFFHTFVKAVAFFLAVLLLAGAVTIGLQLGWKYDTLEPVVHEDYLQSDQLENKIDSLYYYLDQLVSHYQNEEHVRSGATIREEELETEIQNLYHEKYSTYFDNAGEIGYSTSEDIEKPYETQASKTDLEVMHDYWRNMGTDYERDREVFIASYPEEIEQIRQKLIQFQLYEYKETLDAIEQIAAEGFLYYARAGENVVGNIEQTERSFFTAQPAYIILDGGDYLTSFQGGNERYSVEDQKQIFVALEEQTAIALSDAWTQARDPMIRDMVWIAGMLFAALLLVIYLLVATGKSSLHQKTKTGLLERIYVEIRLVLLGIAVAGEVVLLDIFLRYIWENEFIKVQASERMWIIGLEFAGHFLLIGLMLALLLSLMRSIKAKTILKESIIYKVLYLIVWKKIVLRFFKWLVESVHALYGGKAFRHYPFQQALFNRQLIYVLTLAFIVMFFGISLLASSLFFALLFVAAGIIITVFYIKGNQKTFGDMGKLLDEIGRIKDGGYQQGEPALGPDSDFYEAAKQLSSIEEGLKESLERSLHAERMKVDLVTNVSHDLKTPLTSIISYIDLMQKEEDLPPHLKDYVSIIAVKAERLKTLIQDLFDLSKATSGELHLEMERLDYAKLLRQTLADLSEEINKTGISFRITIPEEPVMIRSDGKQLYRVFENLVSNALKYSLAGSRVYVTLTVENGIACACIQNTANYEMDFVGSEVLERFVRGDKARSTEGSGLGLSIAQSFTASCGGRFEVVVDGDQFKVLVSFAIDK